MNRADLSTSRPRSDLRIPIGVALLLVYALSTLAPPGATAATGAPPGASLWIRLFPGVPPWWMFGRLACLLVGVVLLARGARVGPDVRLEPAAAEPPPISRPWAWAAGVVAVAQLLALLFAGGFSVTGEFAYLLVLAVPPLLLAVGERARFELPSAARGAVLVSLAIIAAWVVFRFMVAWHAPRTGVLVDLWPSFSWLLEEAGRTGGVLNTTGQPGIGKTYMLLMGLPFMGPEGVAVRLALIQLLHCLWIALTAVGMVLLSARLLAPTSPLLVVSAFLFSPLMLMMPFNPSPFGIFTSFAVALLALLLWFRATGSVAALSGLAVVAGLSTTSAYLFNVVALGGVVTGILMLRRRSRPVWLHWGVPILCFLTAGLPSLPDLDEIGEMRSRYVELSAPWAPLEGLMLGQRSPYDPPVVTEIWSAGEPGALDIPLGALLSPFATPRTAIRLWADTYLEPLSAALGAVGIGLCLAAVRFSAGARALLLLFVVSVVPAGLASAYDRASLLRNLSLPLVMAPLAAVAFEFLRRRLVPRVPPLPVALAVALAMATSGLWIADVVVPRVLPSSWHAIALEATEESPPAGGARLLEHEATPWLYVGLIGSFAPRVPMPAQGYKSGESLTGPDGEPIAEVVLWSPALEKDGWVTRELCGRWPDATLFALEDRPGISRAYAARRAGSSWTPSLPSERWSSRTCSGV